MKLENLFMWDVSNTLIGETLQLEFIFFSYHGFTSWWLIPILLNGFLVQAITSYESFLLFLFVQLSLQLYDCKHIVHSMVGLAALWFLQVPCLSLWLTSLFNLGLCALCCGPMSIESSISYQGSFR